MCFSPIVYNYLFAFISDLMSTFTDLRVIYRKQPSLQFWSIYFMITLQHLRVLFPIVFLAFVIFFRLYVIKIDNIS